MSKNYIWTSANGKKTPFDELDHQHLSNILWFNEIINGWNWRDNQVMSLLENEILDRFNGRRLSWKPLPIPNEIMWIKNMGLIDKDQNIVFKGEIVGTIRHIKN